MSAPPEEGYFAAIMHELARLPQCRMIVESWPPPRGAVPGDWYRIKVTGMTGHDVLTTGPLNSCLHNVLRRLVLEDHDWSALHQKQMAS